MIEYLYSTPAKPVYTKVGRAYWPWPIRHTGFLGVLFRINIVYNFIFNSYIDGSGGINIHK